MTEKTIETIAPPSRAGAGPSAGPGRRLGPRWRKATLTLHIVSAGSWIGVDVIVAVLVLTGWFSADMTVRGLAYRSLALFVVWPMLTSGLVCLVTGLVLGAGSRWGLVRYWWVAVKLVINLALCTLIVVLLRPTLDEVGAYGRGLLAGSAPARDVSSLFFPPAVSLTALALATALAVVKPWGPIRSASPRGGR